MVKSLIAKEGDLFGREYDSEKSKKKEKKQCRQDHPDRALHCPVMRFRVQRL